MGGGRVWRQSPCDSILKWSIVFLNITLRLRYTLYFFYSRFLMSRSKNYIAVTKCACTAVRVRLQRESMAKQTASPVFICIYIFLYTPLCLQLRTNHLAYWIRIALTLIRSSCVGYSGATTWMQLIKFMVIFGLHYKVYAYIQTNYALMDSLFRDNFLAFFFLVVG